MLFTEVAVFESKVGIVSDNEKTKSTGAGCLVIHRTQIFGTTSRRKDNYQGAKLFVMKGL